MHNMKEVINYGKKINFENGYTASIICGNGAGTLVINGDCRWTKGGHDGLFEIAVIHDDRIVYDTPITDDVMGFLDFFEVAEVLNKIKNLPPR